MREVAVTTCQKSLCKVNGPVLNDADDDECNYLIHDVLQDDTKETAPDTIDTDRHAVCYTDQPEVGVLCSVTYSRQSVRTLH